MTPPDAAVAAPKKRMTVDEYWDFVNRPENEDRMFELHRGEVVELARPRKPHGFVCANISRLLGNHSFATGFGYVIGNDSGVVLAESPGTVVGSDVAYFSDTKTFEDLEPKWSEDPPLIAVEVRSPNDKRKAAAQKIREYLTNGVAAVWEVDYEERFVIVHRLNKPTQIVGEGETMTADELPGFSCPIADIFRMPVAFLPPPSA